MTPTRLCATLVICSALAGCGATTQYLIDPPPTTTRLPDRLGRIVVRDVDLPQYASAAEITTQGADGALHAERKQLWAQNPGHAITLALADQIQATSGATAVAEPWPLSSGPDRKLEVRIERLLAGPDGQFRLTGQYFIAPVAGAGRDIARRFAISVPITQTGPAGVAEAQSRAIQALAIQIAQLK